MWKLQYYDDEKQRVFTETLFVDSVNTKHLKF